MRALSALLAAAILLAAPTPSAPVAVSQQSTKTQQVQQAPKEEETQKPPIPDPAKSTLPIKADSGRTTAHSAKRSHSREN